METIDHSNGSRTASFIVTLLFLVAMVTGMGIMFGLTLHGAQGATDEVKKLLRLLAWMSVAMLGLTLLMLFWLVVRFMMRRIRPQGHGPTEYVDAWSLAGKRVKPQVEVLDDEGEDEDRDDQ